MSLFRSVVLAAVLAGSFLTVSQSHAANSSNQQVIMGWVEYVYIPNMEGRLKAKLDTGATTSSMRAEVVKVLDEDKPEKASVLFQITDAEGKTNTLQRKLVRWVKIKTKDGKHQRRPVVEMDFCVAGHAITSEVNLAPRATFIYPILVGRNMMKTAKIIVDPERTFTSKIRCPMLDSDDKE